MLFVFLVGITGSLTVLILGAILFTDITGIWLYSILVQFSTRLITLLKQPSFSMQQWITLP
jgi:hypothetical protein